MQRQHAEAIVAQANAVAALVNAGVSQDRAWEIFGGDPAMIEGLTEE